NIWLPACSIWPHETWIFAESTIWEVKTGKALLTLKNTGAMALNADGKRLVITDNAQTTTVWEVDTGKELQAIKKARVIAISPDATRLAGRPTGERRQGGGLAQIVPTFRLWDVATGKPVLTIEEEVGLFAFGGASPYLARFSPDGKRLSVLLQRSLKVFDA